MVQKDTVQLSLDSSSKTVIPQRAMDPENPMLPMLLFGDWLFLFVFNNFCMVLCIMLTYQV